MRGKAGDRLDDADQLRRAEDAAEIAEARREVGDLDRGAVFVGEHRRDDGRVALVVRRVIDHAVEHDVGESLLLIARDKAREHRIAVEARIAPPDETRSRLEQSGGLPVADDGEV